MAIALISSLLRPCDTFSGQKHPASEGAQMDSDNPALPPWSIRAGARQTIYFDPSQVNTYVHMILQDV